MSLEVEQASRFLTLLPPYIFSYPSPLAAVTALETEGQQIVLTPSLSFLNQVILLPYTPKGTVLNLRMRAQEVMVVSIRAAYRQWYLLIVT